jgi:hypothetical protein
VWSGAGQAGGPRGVAGVGRLWEGQEAAERHVDGYVSLPLARGTAKCTCERGSSASGGPALTAKRCAGKVAAAELAGRPPGAASSLVVGHGGRRRSARGGRGSKLTPLPLRCLLRALRLRVLRAMCRSTPPRPLHTAAHATEARARRRPLKPAVGSTSLAHPPPYTQQPCRPPRTRSAPLARPAQKSQRSGQFRCPSA